MMYMDTVPVAMDFCCNHGVPNELCYDNTPKLQSSKVLEFNQTYLVRDKLSEVYNQHQNPVKTGGIRWLKMALHIFLDITGAPEWTLFLAICYLVEVHNCRQNDAKKFIPQTACDGCIHDISNLLQFSFQKHVLYLENVDVFPASKERNGYFVAFDPNIGDALTFKVVDDEMKQAVCVRVV